MSEAAPLPPPPDPLSNPPLRRATGLFEPGRSNVQIIYFLCLAGFVFPVTHLIAVVMAYLGRGEGEAWLDSHYTYQIRTFWIGIVYGLASIVLLFAIIGFVLIPLVAIWVVVRCIRGLQAAGRREPIANPATWLF